MMLRIINVDLWQSRAANALHRVNWLREFAAFAGMGYKAIEFAFASVAEIWNQRCWH